jgi:putative phage-type endonuclease
MDAIKIKVPEDHSDWLDQRRKGIGGSDAGAILGLNPYKSKYALWAEKTGKLDDSVPDNEAMRVGRDLEDYVAKRFMEETGKRVRKSGFSYRSKEHPFMLANVDRLIIGEDAGLECKTANAMSKVDWAGGDIPPSYYCQCYHYMAVTGLKRWYIAILVMGKGFYWHCIERDEAEIEALVEAEENFWHLVETDEEPEIDGSDATTDAIAVIYAESQRYTCQLQNTADLIEEIMEENQNIKESQERVKQLQNQIKAEMQDAEKAETDFYKISWKTQTSNRVDTALLKKEFPDVYKYCLKQSESRPFKITFRKDLEK